MSRIGYKPIELPEAVSLVREKNTVVVKGPKGELKQDLDPEFKLEQKDGIVKLERPSDQKRHKALHGLYRSLINNMVVGVSQGFKLQLELVGVGYKSDVQGKILEMNVGYSHNIYIGIPEELTVTSVTEKGKNPTITIEGTDKQLVGEMAAKIKSFRKVEPYKGKGIQFVGEQIRRKAGKTAAAK